MESSMFDNLKTKLGFKSESITDQSTPEIDVKALSSDDVRMFLLASEDAVWSTPSYSTAAAEGYSTNPIVYRCINLRGDSIGALRWTVCDKNDKEIPNHPLQKLIDRPNTQQSQSEFFSAFSKYRDLAGDGYMIANRSEGGKPSELYLVRPDNVTIMPGNFGVPSAYNIASGALSSTYAVDPITGKSDVLNWKLFNPLSDIHGMSPLAASAKPIDVFNEAEEHSKKLLQNGANLGGVLSTEQKLDAAQFTRLQEAITTKYGGGRNAGKMMITEGGMKYTSTSTSPKDMMLTESQTEQARYICQSLAVPDQMVGLPGSSTFANFTEARIYYIENTVIPMAESLQECLNYWLSPMFGDGVYIKYDVNSIVGLEERRSEMFSRMEGVSFMTVNEKRARVGLEPITGGDTLDTINSNIPPENSGA